jgi:DNA-binding FadR family transcriptional regulator
MKKSLSRPSLNILVRDYIVEFILNNGLNPGDPLPPETQLVEELGLGRSSIREAVKILQSLGIIEVRHGSGLFVRENNFDPIREIVGYGLRFDTRTLKEITEIRLLLERAAIEEVVAKITNRDIKALEDLLKSWQQKLDEGKDNLQDDMKFHRILNRSLGNIMLMKLLEEFWVAFEHYEKSENSEMLYEKPPQQELEDHRRLLEAVKARDAALAVRVLQEHFQQLRENVHLDEKAPAAVSSAKYNNDAASSAVADDDNEEKEYPT